MTPSPAERQLIEEKGAPPGSARYYSLLSLETERRHALTALYALMEFLHQIVDGSREAELTLPRLHWWRQELVRLFEGEPQHPCMRLLYPHRQRLDRAELQSLVDGAELALSYDIYPGFAQLSQYLHLAGSAPTLLGARLLGLSAGQSVAYPHHLGTALALLRRLLRVREDALQGRFFLPEDELQQYQLSPEQLREDTDCTASRALFRHQDQRIRGLLQQADANLTEADRYLLYPLLIRQRLAVALLDELAKADYPLLSGRLHLTPLRKLWLAWRTLSQVRRQHRRAVAST